MSRSGLAALPEATRGLFEAIRCAPGIDRFLLIGGTALALRLGHRLSEDLDFVTVGKLDRRVIVGILEHVHAHGQSTITRIRKVAQELEFDLEGADAENYGQDWRVNGVKLTFFSKRLPTAEAQHVYEDRMQHAAVPGVDAGSLRIATEAFIFASKAQVISERLVSRDLYDLKVLLETGRYTLAELFQLASELGGNADLARERLVNGRLRTDDPPVNLIDGSVINVESLRNWFVEQVNEYERAIAADRRAALLNRPRQ